MLNGRFAAGKDDNVLIRDLLRLNIDIIYYTKYRDIAFRDATYIEELNMVSMSSPAFYIWIRLILIHL